LRRRELAGAGVDSENAHRVRRLIAGQQVRAGRVEREIPRRFAAGRYVPCSRQPSARLVDRENRDAGISAVREAVKAIQQGLNMTIYIEGKRSFDGRLLPFKKGPFYLAEECKVPVVPITISGTQEVMPKARFAIQPGTVTVQFHDPIEPSDFGERDCLMAKVRDVISEGLPQELRTVSSE